MEDYKEIMKRWTNYSKSICSRIRNGNFKTLVPDYKITLETQFAQSLLHNYDPTGMLSVIMVKNLFMKMMQDSSISILDLLENNYITSEEEEMYDIFTSPEIVCIENRFVSIIRQTAKKYMNEDFIAEYDYSSEDVVRQITTVVRSLRECKKDIYKKGGEIEEIKNISVSIHPFHSLAELLLVIENNLDGIYLCYVEEGCAADGYFGFFIKSNGNIFSIHDRVDEAYPGIHAFITHGKWMENKQTQFFPYEYFLHYCNKYKDKREMPITDKEKDVFTLLFMAAMFLVQKYKGEKLEDEIMYVDSLLPSSIQTGLENNGNDFISKQISFGSSFLDAHKEIDLNFPILNIIDGSALLEFSGKENKREDGYIKSENKNQEMVDLWGYGFDYVEPIQNQMLFENSDIPEYVGSIHRLRAEVLYDARKQLAYHMRRNMYEEYIQYGGMLEVKRWYKGILKNNIDKIEALIASNYDSNIISEDDGNFKMNFSESQTPIWYFGNQWEDGIILNDKNETGYLYKDKRTKNICNRWIVIMPCNYKVIEKFFEVKVPQIMRGWLLEGHHRTGNPNLEMTDPVEDVGTIFEHHEINRATQYLKTRIGYVRPSDINYQFSFAIGYTKRGFTTMLKEKQ